MAKTKIQALDILNETWDLLHNLEAREDESHQKAIRENKTKLERLMYALDIKNIDFPVLLKA